MTRSPAGSGQPEERVKARRAVQLKHPDKISCLALHHPYLYQLSSCICPSRCPSEDSWSLLPTPRSSHHWPGHRKNPKPQRLFRGSSTNPCLLSPRKVVKEGWTRGPDPMFTVSLPSATSTSCCKFLQDRVCRERSLGATPLSLGGAGEMLGGGKTHLKQAYGF